VKGGRSPPFLFEVRSTDDKRLKRFWDFEVFSRSTKSSTDHAQLFHHTIQSLERSVRVLFSHPWSLQMSRYCLIGERSEERTLWTSRPTTGLPPGNRRLHLSIYWSPQDAENLQEIRNHERGSQEHATITKLFSLYSIIRSVWLVLEWWRWERSSDRRT
jgi:hypothetical protein